MGATELLSITGQCDQVFSTLFASLEQHDPPEDRYLLLADLLGHPDQQLVCRESRARKEALIRSACAAAEPIRERLRALRQELRRLFDGTTYTVVSYWSPLDRRRRSIYRRWEPPRGDARRLAAATLFYASTFVGTSSRDPTSPLTSIIQYLSEGARAKRGFTIKFKRADASEAIFSIPPVAYSIWEEVGIDDLVAELSAAVPPEQLDADLFSVISGSAEGPSLETSLFVDRFRMRCRAVAWSLSGAAGRYLDHEREKINRLFDNPENQLVSRDQALFFVVTSQLWRYAVGENSATNYMYAFPTTVGNASCILTTGTGTPLSYVRQLEIAYIARSAFVQPLLLDFRTNEKRGMANRRNNAFRRVLGHNLPKILIHPGMNELVKMERAVERLPYPEGGILALSIRNLQLIFEHYESFLTAVMCSNKLEHQFERDPTPFDISGLWGHVRLAFELCKESLASSTLRAQTSLDMDLPDNVILDGHQELLREVLVIIVNNALNALHPETVAANPSRGTLSLRAWVDVNDGFGGAELVIEIADRGDGFDPKKLDSFHTVQRLIAEAASEDFWSTVSTIIEERLPVAREEHLGIGLIFCLAYLRCLEWAPKVSRRGHLNVSSSVNEGTVVTLRVPGVRI